MSSSNSSSNSCSNTDDDPFNFAVTTTSDIENSLSDDIHRHKSIQKAIDQACDYLLTWNTEFKMDVIVNGVLCKNHDIFSHVDTKFCNQSRPLDPIIRFDPNKYSIDQGFKGSGFAKLIKDIEACATFHGFDVVFNGGGKYRYVRCNHHRQYRNNKQSLLQRQQTKYRSVSHCNDRKNSRGRSGLKMSRNSSTQRPLDKDHCCPFYFNIVFDDFSFHLVNGCGVNQHKFHPKIEDQKSRFPAQLLDDAEKNSTIYSRSTSICRCYS